MQHESRLESGVLPVVIAGDFAAYWASTGLDLAKAGMRAGLFHPTTGYSFPDAVRLAVAITEAPDLSHPALVELTRRHAESAWAGRGFYRALDTMLFRAAEPERRYRVLERFYRLNPGLIQRFYAAESTWRIGRGCWPAVRRCGWTGRRVRWPAGRTPWKPPPNRRRSRLSGQLSADRVHFPGGRACPAVK